METENKKNEEITIKGKVRSGYSELPEVTISKVGDKPLAKFAIYSRNGEETKITTCVAWDTNIPKVEKLVKDDLVEIKGYYGKEYPTKTGELKQDFIVKECTKLNTSLKGNIGQGFNNNPEVIIKEVNGKQVANFSICINDNTEEKKWFNCQAWGDKIKAVEHFKKGDFVELKGVYGNEYVTSKGEKKQDFIVNSSSMIISSNERIDKKKEEEKLNPQDAALVLAVKKGDYQQVEKALKNGGNPDSISPDHYNNLSDKSRKAIENAIDKHNLGIDLSDEKKSNKMSM